MSSLLSNRTGSRDNNFNLLRFVAALMVLFSHSYPLAGTPKDPLRDFGLSFGGVAVDVFFITSGFLVTGSLMNGRNLASFLRNRALRIYPALTVAVVLCAFGVGLAFSRLPAVDFLAKGETYQYLLTNILMFGRPQQFGLPGVFLENPYPAVVNGSLWTLPWEMKMYGILAVFGALAYVRPPIIGEKTLRYGLVVLGGAATALYIYAIIGGKDEEHAGVRFVSTFFMGACFYACKERIILSHRLALIVLGVAACFAYKREIQSFHVVYSLALGYLVLYLAYVPQGVIRQYNRLGDYSYGTYIYAFPVQQSVAALWPGVSTMKMFGLSLVFTLLLATASWHLVEKPCLNLKRRSG